MKFCYFALYLLKKIAILILSPKAFFYFTQSLIKDNLDVSQFVQITPGCESDLGATSVTPLIAKG